MAYKHSGDYLRVLREEGDLFFKTHLWKEFISKLLEARRIVSREIERTPLANSDRIYQVAKYQGELDGINRSLRTLVGVLDVKKEEIPGIGENFPGL